jgi:hypothetical protein
MLQAVRMMCKTPVGPASQAGPELLRFFGIVALNTGYRAVLDMKSQWTSATAIEGGRCSDYLRLSFRLVFLFGTHRVLLRRI